MISLISGVLLGPLAYGFGPGTHYSYQLDATFTGFIPIMGGQDGVARVVLDLNVNGAKGEDATTSAASSELTDAKIYFNEALLPLSKDNVTSFFPKTTIQVTPLGEIMKSDAPDIKVPVRLPGLDVKRFPDITYVPIVFPKDEVKAGDHWSFTKKFSGSELTYDCNLASSDDKTAVVNVKVNQDITSLEDDSMNITTEKDAVRSVKTHMTGTGTMVFDQKLKVFRTVNLKAHSESEVTDLKSKEKSTRKLDTEFKCVLKSPTWSDAAEKKVAKAWWENAWDTTKAFGSDLYARSKGYALYAKEAYSMVMRLLLGGGR